jgi:hypothetical protein
MKAKRVAPKKVDPVTYKGITYTAPHYVPGEKQNGGFIEARNSNNELIYRFPVYHTRYKTDLEKDLQDVFIKEITVSENILIVTDENNRIFHINLITREIKKIK